MELVLALGRAFLVGGILCALAQVLVDKTKLTPARILVIYVVAGVIFGAIGVYDCLIDWAGAGASIPISGFGSAMARGMREAIDEHGVLGLFTGVFTAGSAGLGAAVAFGYLAALLSKPGDKK